MAMEPAWALFFAVVLTGESMNAVQGLGAALVLIAVAGHEALPLLTGTNRAGGGAGGGGGVRPGRHARRLQR
jgi:hypothetical protein